MISAYVKDLLKDSGQAAAGFFLVGAGHMALSIAAGDVTFSDSSGSKRGKKKKKRSAKSAKKRKRAA